MSKPALIAFCDEVVRKTSDEIVDRDSEVVARRAAWMAARERNDSDSYDAAAEEEEERLASLMEDRRDALFAAILYRYGLHEVARLLASGTDEYYILLGDGESEWSGEAPWNGTAEWPGDATDDQEW
jgi:hypothetical protein